ncbi:hypothetical protein ElyMa_000293700 [Elysia marginata]|uniref:Uncharacterized protein n=1 Tax=Elysia marginata TaxID=1093978 RepID=A0AAV4F8P0_9GAST|nr:hypothetical protein ElyMa_000293700 [Elysia marginata]
MRCAAMYRVHPVRSKWILIKPTPPNKGGSCIDTAPEHCACVVCHSGRRSLGLSVSRSPRQPAHAATVTPRNHHTPTQAERVPSPCPPPLSPEGHLPTK